MKLPDAHRHANDAVALLFKPGELIYATFDATRANQGCPATLDEWTRNGTNMHEFAYITPIRSESSKARRSQWTATPTTSATARWRDLKKQNASPASVVLLSAQIVTEWRLGP